MDKTWKLPCYSNLFITKEINLYDKILLPKKILSDITKNNQNIEYPLIFKITFESKNICACVLEFTDDDKLFMPYWLMKNFYNIKEGDEVSIKLTKVKKGTLVKLRPQTTDFITLDDVLSVLEFNFKNFTILNKGTTVIVKYFDKEYNIDILETNPEEHICILDTDLNIDLEKPLDYVEPEYKPKKKSLEYYNSNNDSCTNTVFTNHNDDSSDDSSDEEFEEFVPFSGKGYKLGS